MLRAVAACAFALIVTTQLRAQSQAPARTPSDGDIRRLLAERIDTYRQSAGIVIGIIEAPGRRRIVSYGTLAQGDPRPVNGDTVFEIGSLTKVFTSLLLADMVGRGEVALNDPVARYLPAGVKVPERKGRQITLEDLATHMSGLPREASNFEPVLTDWEADYSEASLYEFLSSYQLTRDIGSENDYSNVGVALLGLALTRRTGTDYDSLVRTRIAEPLGLHSTRVSTTPDMASRLATGHFYRLTPAPPMTLQIFAPAGGLHSTVNDLLTLLGAHLGYQRTPLDPAMTTMLSVERQTMPPLIRSIFRDRWQHLGWFEVKDVMWHNGATLGYRSFMGFAPKTGVGVVILSNAGGGAGVDDIGLHLLNPKQSLLDGKALAPLPAPNEITLAPDSLEQFVGRYEVSPRDWLAVSRIDDKLLVDGNGDPIVRFYPESDTSFFSREFEGRIVFKRDRAGRTTELVWSARGNSKRYKRVP